MTDTIDIAETIKFRDICQMLEKLKMAENEASKLKYLRRYYESFLKHRDRFRQQMNIAQDEENGSTSFYCILRCLIPNADKAREAYGLQISTLGKVYIKVLQLSPDSRDAQRLYAKSSSGMRGDYADVVYTVLQPRCNTEPSNLNMKQIHSMLDSIASEDRRNTEKELTRLCESASAQEQKWFIRLLLKSMHLRLREQSVFALLHPQAKEIYQRCSDLLLVCSMLTDNKLAEAGNGIDAKNGSSAGDQLNLNDTIQPFRHIRPMLCEIFPGNIETLMSADVMYMETKMDGERFQLHYNEGKFKYISRNGVDYTYAFGADYSSGSLTPALNNLLPIGMQSIILDGEMMVWDTRAQRYRVKAENTDVKHLQAASSGSGSWRPCYVVYDLLYLNGHSLLDLPYVQRSHKLREILKEDTGVLQTMKPKKIGTKEEFGSMFQVALDAHEEGVVLKKQNARYSPGTRSGGGWYKAKADYIKGLTTEFDLLIMGGFYNRKRTFIESFLLGVLKYISPSEYFIYSVGTVLNVMRQRVVLNDTLREHWHEIASEAPPLWYNFKNVTEGRPDVWIDPKNSTILQIKAADLSPASSYMLEKSLHFPRVQAWRNDKVWNECMTYDEFQGMCKNNKGVLKINKRELRQEDYTTDRKRFKLTPAQSRKLGALAYENKIDPNEVLKSSDFLQGFSFCILSTKLDSGYTIADLKRLVVCNGGEIVENPLPSDPKCISLAGDITYRVERLLKSKRYNIVSLPWLFEVCESQQIMLKPNNMICMTDDLKEQFQQHFDAYGDSYTECGRMRDVKILLDSLEDNEEVTANPLSMQEMYELEQELFGNESPNYFRNITGYFYDSTNIKPRTKLAKLTFQWRGGKMVKINDRLSLQYIFIDDAATKDSNEFILWQAKNVAFNVKIVNINWILHSESNKRKLDINQYLCATV